LFVVGGHFNNNWNYFWLESFLIWNETCNNYCNIISVMTNYLV
jgi:hypothetical protein